jgi:hypothetical protein
MDPPPHLGNAGKSTFIAVPPRTIEDLVVGLHAAVTMVNANMLRRAWENSARGTAICLEMDGGRFEHQL